MRVPFQSLFEVRTGRWQLSQLKSWSDMGVGDGPTRAGVSISESTVEGLPTVFSCVRVIASAVAQLPLKLFRRESDGSKHEASDHPLFEVLHDLANPEMTAYELRSLMTSQLLLWGNAYADIVRNPRGEVTALWPLCPWKMRIVRDDRRRLRFHYPGRDAIVYDPNLPQILRLSIHSEDGVVGRSVVRVLRESLGLTLALERFGATFFGNGSTFGGVLSSDADLDDEQLKDARGVIEQLHQGPDRAHRFLVLKNGYKYTPLGLPPEDAQFLESRKFQRSELCGVFGVPPNFIGDLERATFSNIESESIRWLRDGLEPHLVNWESAIRRDCLGPRAFSRYYGRFVRNAMLRGDLLSRSRALATMRQNGVINADEWRQLEEMDPIEGAGGKVYVLNTAAQPLTAVGQDDDPPPPREP